MQLGCPQRTGSLHFSRGKWLLRKKRRLWNYHAGRKPKLVTGVHAEEQESATRGSKVFLDVAAQLPCQLNAAQWVASPGAIWGTEAFQMSPVNPHFCCSKSLSFEVVCYTTDKLINKWNSIIYMFYITGTVYFYYFWSIWEKVAEIMTPNISVCISNEPNIIL